jgi:hypothetical protein
MALDDEEYFDRAAQQYGDTLGRYLDQTVTPYQPVPMIPPYESQEPQGPIYQPQAQAQVPYGEPQGPIYQDAGLGLGDPQGPVYQPAPAPATDMNPMARWADPVERGGLGLSMSSPAMASPGGTPAWATALRGIGGALEGFSAGYFGRTPMFMQQQRLDQQQQQIDQMNAYRRDMLGQQLQAQKERARQHNWQVAEKLIATGNIEALAEFGKQFPEAGLIAQAVSKQDLAELPTFIERGYIPEEFAQRIRNPQPGQKLPSPGEIRAQVDMAKSMFKEDLKTEAKERQLKMALDTPVEKRKPSQQMLVDEHQAAVDLKKAQTEEQLALAAKNRREAEQGNVKFTQMTQEISSELFDKPFENLTQSQRAVVEREKEHRLHNRTSPMITQGLPVAVKERSNVIDRRKFLKTGELVMPPGGITKAQMDSGDYTEITDKQKEAWGEVENSGQTLKSLFGMVEPLITAKTSAQALKQYANLSVGAISKKNPAAATYAADSEAFSSRMARVFGSEVGVLTQGDVERWKRALPTFGDTVDVMKMKKTVFMDIYNQSRAMAVKKIAGEDISGDVVKLRATLDKVDKINPPSIDEDFNTLMGGKK